MPVTRSSGTDTVRMLDNPDRDSRKRVDRSPSCGDRAISIMACMGSTRTINCIIISVPVIAVGCIVAYYAGSNTLDPEVLSNLASTAVESVRAYTG